MLGNQRTSDQPTTKAKLVKQMYNTLTVRPNIVKPLLATGGELLGALN